MPVAHVRNGLEGDAADLIEDSASGQMSPFGPAVHYFRLAPERTSPVQATDRHVGRHAAGSAIHLLMSDSRQPEPLTLILSWAGNVPSPILR